MPGAAWSPPVPLLTPRLVLRAHRPGDLDDLAAFHGDEEVTRFTPWPVRTREQTAEFLARRTGQVRAAAPGEAVVLAVQERAGGTVVGEVLLLREPDDAALLGYALRRDRWGLGLATEAAGALLEAGFSSWGVRRAAALVVPANTASIAVLRRLGFAPAGAHGDLARFELGADGWRARHPGAAGAPGAAGP
ncbi:GNAT family N-acetyltransferase [Kineococcus gypseus]|uniref:GNAT family N-acetyltransferase n=1 Tax=Kineococcus gypseus TaxID=1637102 RepID=UPI003D7D74E6